MMTTLKLKKYVRRKWIFSISFPSFFPWSAPKTNNNKKIMIIIKMDRRPEHKKKLPNQTRIVKEFD